MPSVSEKLADALAALRALQARDVHAIRSRDLPRTYRDRLVQTKYLEPVMKGWYIASRPDTPEGDSTPWFSAYWDFCATYLNVRFGKKWILSPEQSLLLHAGRLTVPDQLIVRVESKASNNARKLPHQTSLLDVKLPLPTKEDRTVLGKMRVYTIPAALCAVPQEFYIRHPDEARAALAMVADSSDVLAPLLKGNHTIVAGRLAGAFRNIGRKDTADQIIATFKRTWHDIREEDPFEKRVNLNLDDYRRSPYVNRIRLMWHEMRESVIDIFPSPPGTPPNPDEFMKLVSDAYKSDAYHSLSIEGYRVSEELIEKVRSGKWDPKSKKDKADHNAMAARGYYQAFESVKASVSRVLAGANPGEVASRDHRTWYFELFDPSVKANILKQADLAGYRRHAVFISRSKHVTPPHDAVRDLMPALFELLRDEPHPAVRAVLGHFVFVYIHPYMDGNGRMGRFLMNVMLASGGYPWTVVPVTARAEYMASLESASTRSDILPFTRFLANLVNQGLAGHPVPPVGHETLST